MRCDALTVVARSIYATWQPLGYSEKIATLTAFARNDGVRAYCDKGTKRFVLPVC